MLRSEVNSCIPTVHVYVEIFVGILFREILKKLAPQSFGGLIFANTWHTSYSDFLRPNFHGFYFRECRLTREIRES